MEDGNISPPLSHYDPSHTNFVCYMILVKVADLVCDTDLVCNMEFSKIVILCEIQTLFRYGFNLWSRLGI